MKQRFYFDTSVFGGVYDIEFDEPTLQLFEKVKLGELENAPQRVRDFFNELPPANLENIFMTDESLELEREYINEKVVGKTSFDDCVHIALATINNADILVSWNFKHIRV